MKFIDNEVFLFDFDGVIINSNEVRIDGFRKIFAEYPKVQVDNLIRYHNENGGLSRYVKIKYFYNKILRRKIAENEIINLASKFSELMVVELSKKKYLINDCIAIINYLCKQNKMLHIVSGSDEKELNYLCKKLSINKYFNKILGSPTPKIEIVRGLIKKYDIKKSSCCLIGDSINDYEAARENSIKFYGVNNEQLEYTHNYFSNMSELIS